MLPDMQIPADHSTEASSPSCSPVSAKHQAIIVEVLTALETDKLDLPVLPDMAHKVNALVNDPDSSTNQFVQLLSTDLAITLYLVKAANSAIFSNNRPVGNLHDAIPRLGYRMILSLVMNIILTKLFHAHNPLINQRLKELWEHSCRVAANSYVLAQNKHYLKPEDAIMAGMVHEIGALPLYLYADHRYPEIDPDSLDVLIGTFSAPIGFQLLQSWKFPDELINVVADQLDLRCIPQSDEADYVDVVTMAKLQVRGASKTVEWRNILAAEKLGYYPGDCKNFSVNHANQLAAINSMLEMGTT